MTNTDKISYSLIKNDEGAFTLRSVINSYGLDHVTDKDVASFYKTFSQFASFDTGLLPLNGTGVLAIRSAGHHTQIVTQHAAGLYYVNWGAYEGDNNAVSYYVAQPYRIVIGDFENGNLLGARMFYSPYPITSPSNVLYHVNLPNINCRGYRGNGVGWICLYHKDDWSSLPFNEKVSRFIERCSGVETYNDANMSETDGPRFYQMNNKPSYVYNPSDWQNKSQEGFEWTLDENLWIPVLVKDMDNQSQHDPNGQPLTLAMAMLGNYQAYYSDTSIPKLYNVISRPDFNLTAEHVYGMFKKSFALAPSQTKHEEKDNPYQFTVNNRQKNGSEKLVLPLFQNDDEDNENEENTFFCEHCQSTYDYDENDSITTYYDTLVCDSCIAEDYCYISSVGAWFSKNDDSILWSSEQQEFYHIQYDTVFVCDNCSDAHGISGISSDKSTQIKDHNYYNSELGQICKDCFYLTLKDYQNPPIVDCKFCSKEMIDDFELQSHVHKYSETIFNGTNYLITNSYICHTCAPDFVYCPCGILKQKEDVSATCEPTVISDDSGQKLYTVNKCCTSCLGNIHTNDQDQLVADYFPISSEAVNLVISSGNYNKMYHPYIVHTIPEF